MGGYVGVRVGVVDCFRPRSLVGVGTAVDVVVGVAVGIVVVGVAVGLVVVGCSRPDLQLGLTLLLM